MAKRKRKRVSVGTAIRGRYDATESGFEKWIAEFAKLGHVSRCVKGCAACCELLAMVSWPEALALAEDLGERGLTEQFVPDLVDQSKRAMEAGDQTGYWNARIPCAFLDPETKTCSVYDARPTACRYHVVFSPRELCSQRPSAEIIGPNAIPAMQHVVGPIVDALVREGDKDVLTTAPIPIMVLAALKAMGAPIEIPVTPREWMERWGLRVMHYHRANMRRAAP